MTQSKISVTSEDKKTLGRKPVQSLPAFEEFSKGVELLTKKELGDPDQTLLPRATGLLMKATELDSSFGFAQYQLAMLLHNQRDYEAAKVALQRFLMAEPTGKLADHARRLLDQIEKQ